MEKLKIGEQAYLTSLYFRYTGMDYNRLTLAVVPVTIESLNDVGAILRPLHGGRKIVMDCLEKQVTHEKDEKYIYAHVYHRAGDLREAEWMKLKELLVSHVEHHLGFDENHRKMLTTWSLP